MRRGVVLAAAVAVLLIIAGAIFVVGPPLLKGSSSSTGPASTLGAGSSTSSQGSARTGVGEDWTTYHGNNARTGYEQVANFTSVTRDWNSTPLDGIVFAEPLVYGGRRLRRDQRTIGLRPERADGQRSCGNQPRRAR